MLAAIGAGRGRGCRSQVMNRREVLKVSCGAALAAAGLGSRALADSSAAGSPIITTANIAAGPRRRRTSTARMAPAIRPSRTAGTIYSSRTKRTTGGPRSSTARCSRNRPFYRSPSPRTARFLCGRENDTVSVWQGPRKHYDGEGRFGACDTDTQHQCFRLEN